MIAISAENSVQIRAFLLDIRDAVPSEIWSVLSVLDEQAAQLSIEEGLLSEVIALLCIETSSQEKKDGRKITKKQKNKIDHTMRDLVVVLNELQTQQRMSITRRMRR